MRERRITQLTFLGMIVVIAILVFYIIPESTAERLGWAYFPLLIIMGVVCGRVHTHVTDWLIEKYADGGSVK